MPAFTYTVIAVPDMNGGYAAYCPSLPGVAVEGKSVAEALAKARDAIEEQLESLRSGGLPVPEDRGACVSLQMVTLPDEE